MSADAWTWGTVTQVSPLAVRLDGDTDPLPASPGSLVQILTVGTRVWCQLASTAGAARRVIVHGPSPEVLDSAGLLLPTRLPVSTPWAMAAGTVSIALSAAASASTSVTFPVGRFTVAPHIALTQSSLPGSSGQLIGKYTTASASGFTAYAYTGNAATVTTTAAFSWIAVQMQSGAAGG